MFIRKFFIGVALLLFLLNFSCNKKTDKPFELMENTGIVFENNVEDQELNNSFLFRNFYNGGGVAIGDINNDGNADVMLTSNMGENKLFINNGNWKFDDITPTSGLKQDSMWSTGVVMVDINNDNWLDMFVCNSGHMKTGNRINKLYINNHDLSFTESAKEYGLDIVGYTTQVSFFDYDSDDDLDCFMINNSPIPVNTLNNANRRDLPDAKWPVADFLKGGGNHLYRNDNGYFNEVTEEAGIHSSLISFGLGVSVGDINGDNYPDVFVSNDSYERDYLYINQKNGTFKDELEQYMQHTSMSSMGADLADINNDGYQEIFTTDMKPLDDYRLKTTGSFDNFDFYNSKVKSGFYHQYVKNCLQLNNKNGKYIDIANYSGVSATDWSWGALMFDADNDGYNDIFVCNGVNRDVTNLDFMEFFANDVIQKMILTGKKDNVEQVLQKIPSTPLLNKFYKNMGNLKFSDVGESWGFNQLSFSNGAAYGDLDNDGDFDLVVNNENGPAFIYKNNSREKSGNHYLGIQLKGNSKNTFAIGSGIKLYIKDQILMREVMPSRGFQSSVDYKQIFGLGTLSIIDSLIITWADRTFTKIINPSIDTVLVFAHSESKRSVIDAPVQVERATLFLPEKSEFEKHVEDNNIDFYYERNVPQLLSREGPSATVGDINDDGLEDIYIGGTQGHVGQIYQQTITGTFVKMKQPAFDRFPDFEDDAVLFFDADGDEDLDLYVGPGGNNSPPYSRQMQNRLFKNDGRGNFILDAAAFSDNGMNTGVAIAYDFNHDGFNDLFIGGRSVPREYGSAPSSFLCVNNGEGHFTDIAPTNNKDIANIGMVTGAVWADISGDSSKELVITGQWMAPRIFSFNGNKFIEVKSNLNKLLGWWQTIASADLNEDGRQDLILGNIGENFYLHPDSANPVKLWINDYNQNSTLDKILTYTINGKDMPVFLKRDLQDQVPSIKKQNLKHEDYAKRSIQDLFSPAIINKSVVKEFNFDASIVAINTGNGNFTTEKLPAMAQFSSVNSIQCIDVNKDNKIDLVLGGNLYGFLPQFERLDGSFGEVLINNGKGGFTWVDQSKSGLNVQGEVRDIVEIKGKNGPSLLFLKNNDYPVLYQLKN